ncbi:DUF6286 domain-containing protein [Hoyosella sp. YIM 151337]|uniref:DUF6286 domain-containing protein n=1 Tax=Hoyosella sp. YIM 151337 TaxID=2992742 RepID=UPI002235B5B0|nr:DUF6286 domain-containing protein [Hoyosella sp. YIM 151337]MCW4352781.1 DUF6286 domain-containing protein [Hoyosella sp. YIM 151337]
MSETDTPLQDRHVATPRPLGPPASVPGAMLAILLMLSAGALAVWDFLAAVGVVAGPVWVQRAVQHLHGAEAAAWMVLAGAAAGLAGLWLLWRGVKPRGVRAVPAAGEALWVSPAVVAALAESVAAETSGLTHVKARAKRRNVKISATAWGPPEPGLTETIRTGVAARLAALETPPTITVTLRQEGQSK